MLEPNRLRTLAAALAAAALLAACGGGSEETESSSPFEPRASLEAVGGSARSDKPALVMRVTARPGDENIRSVAVRLPTAFFVDATAVPRLCTERELEESDCAGRSPLGSARVVSPAYDAPLTGPVFAVSGSGGVLPDLVYLLGGPAEIELRGNVVSKGARLTTGVEDVPDAPLETFELTIDGGKRGYLVLSRDVCKAPAVADGTFTSQDGRVHEQEIPLEADCGA